jgi:hypothetical protein
VRVSSGAGGSGGGDKGNGNGRGDGKDSAPSTTTEIEEYANAVFQKLYNEQLSLEQV